MTSHDDYASEYRRTTIQRVSLYITACGLAIITCLFALAGVAKAEDVPDVIEVDVDTRFIGGDDVVDTVTVTVDAPAGGYSIVIDTSDAYDGRAEVGNRDEYDKTQTAEVVCIGDDCTLDLADGVDAASATQVITQILHDGGPLELTITHGGGPDVTGTADSVTVDGVTLYRLPDAAFGKPDEPPAEFEPTIANEVDPIVEVEPSPEVVVYDEAAAPETSSTSVERTELAYTGIDTFLYAAVGLLGILIGLFMIIGAANGSDQRARKRSIDELANADGQTWSDWADFGGSAR